MKIPKFKTIIGYGTGITMLGTLESSGISPDWLVDDNASIIGSQVAGIPIYGSDRLLEIERDKHFIVIYASTPQAVRAISVKLLAMGFRPGLDFVDSSWFHFESVKNKLSQLEISADLKLLHKIKRQALFSSIPNLSTITGTWIIASLLKKFQGKSNIAECGVYYGGNAQNILENIPASSIKNYYLFDSFAGFKELSASDPASRKDDFQDTDYGFVKFIFSHYKCVSIYKGYFNDTLPKIDPGMTFDLVYIDCDLEIPAAYCVEFFHQRLREGGMMIVHDYWYPSIERPTGGKIHFEGIKKAIDLFIDKYNYRSIVFPETTHILLYK